MNPIELSQLFVEYAECKEKLAELKAKIEEEVLKLGETTKIAGVTASYYKPGFTTPDYEGFAKKNMPTGFDLYPFTTERVSVKWKYVCDALSLNPPSGKEKPARVVVK